MGALEEMFHQARNLNQSSTAVLQHLTKINMVEQHVHHQHRSLLISIVKIVKEDQHLQNWINVLIISTFGDVRLENSQSSHLQVLESERVKKPNPNLHVSPYQNVIFVKLKGINAPRRTTWLYFDNRCYHQEVHVQTSNSTFAQYVFQHQHSMTRCIS